MFFPVPPGRDEDLLPAGQLPIDARTEQEFRAFVGSHADYYLAAWRPALTGQGRVTRPNFAAFFIPWLWFAYRKMYFAFFVFTLIVVLIEFFLGMLLAARILEDEPPFAVIAPISLILGVTCGVCGDQWYLKHARRTIASVRAKRLDEVTYLRTLSRRGGTSIASLILLPMLMCLGCTAISDILVAWLSRFH
jgi:Protein of unknown function (DUF2628)